MEKGSNKATVLMEALPYIKEHYGRIIVIKYGGNAMLNEGLQETFSSDIVLMRYVGIYPVVVHGGGPQITEYMSRLSKEVRFVEGHRVTDSETMEIAKMVLVGKVNKEIVSRINRHGTLAVGLSGDDGNLLMAKKLADKGGVDLGWVGEVESVNASIVQKLLGDELITVIASVGCDREGNSYNINADLVAGEVATALEAHKLIYLTNVKGIYKDSQDENSLISRMSIDEGRGLMAESRLSEGMIPKMESCLSAVERGVDRAHIIDGTIKHALLLELFTDEGVGTMMVP